MRNKNCKPEKGAIVTQFCLLFIFKLTIFQSGSLCLFLIIYFKFYLNILYIIKKKKFYKNPEYLDVPCFDIHTDATKNTHVYTHYLEKCIYIYYFFVPVMCLLRI